jgi:hypothetical protein
VKNKDEGDSNSGRCNNKKENVYVESGSVEGAQGVLVAQLLREFRRTSVPAGTFITSALQGDWPIVCPNIF